MVLIDCIVRRLPGSLHDAGSASQDSFSDGLLDWPHYTRPEEWNGARVPEVLLSGNHASIARWRRKQALGRTWQRGRSSSTRRSSRGKTGSCWKSIVANNDKPRAPGSGRLCAKGRKAGTERNRQ